MDILKLLTTSRTAWSLREIAMILNIPLEKAKFKVFRWCKKGHLRQVRKGIYVRTDKDYNPLEVACLIFKPSYVSFYTALFLWGAITQGTWTTVMVASYLSREVEVDGWTVKAIKVKDRILYSPRGLILPDKCEFSYTTVASPERALLDTLYILKVSVDIQFPQVFDRNKLEELLDLYFRDKRTLKKYRRLIDRSLEVEK